MAIAAQKTRAREVGSCNACEDYDQNQVVWEVALRASGGLSFRLCKEHWVDMARLMKKLGA